MSSQPRKLVFAIDFDGTIHNLQDRDEGRKMGKPFPGAKTALERINEAGHTILIHTCNSPKVVEKWMEYFEIPFHEIWQDKGKPVADYYIDDRAIRFRENWTDITRELKI